jgi:hypothetical protein
MWIPTKDADLDPWLLNFADLLTTAPATYGLEAADALIVQNQVDIFHAAYLVAINPSTRTKVAVLEKDGEKLTALGIVRMYGAQIRADKGVTDEDKTALGINIPDPTPSPIPVPVTAPSITVSLAGIGVHLMDVRDVLTPDSKAKPQGVAGCVLFFEDAVGLLTELTAPKVAAIVTRADQIISTADGVVGKYRNYAGQWFNRKGEMGPLGGIKAFTIV